MSKNHSKAAVTIGLAVIGSSTIGIVGFIAAIIAVLAGEPTAAGTYLIAAALSFGLLANAVLRE